MKKTITILKQLLNLDTFIETISKTFSIKGRATRIQFWNYHLFLFIFFSMFGFMMVLLSNEILNTILVGLVLISSFSAYTLGIRRLHDINLSGWFIALVPIPLLGALFYYFYLGIKRGVNDNNRFNLNENQSDIAQNFVIK